MSDSNPVSSEVTGRSPPAVGGSRSLEHEPGDMRVEDLGEVEPEEMPTDMGYDQEQRDKTETEKDKKKFKKEANDPKNINPRITKKPTIIGSAYDAYQKEPAYIAPIGPIDPIPAVDGVDGVESPKRPPPPGGINGKDHISSSGRPRIPRWVKARLVGKMIDEYGNIVDNDGSALGRVAGDLPSMVGRTVSNKSGDVLGDDGELLGYVVEIADKNKGKGKEAEMEEENEVCAEAGSNTEDSEENEDETGASSRQTSSPQSIDQYIGKPSASLQVDHRGNILDSLGNIIGHFRDTSKDPKPGEAAAAAATGSHDGSKKPMPDHQGPQGPATGAPGPGSSPRQGGGAEGAAAPGERPKNAADWKKENESPSDIFLDVKSTTEGIQLTIRIPTVFAGQQPRFNFTS
ncbi:hypothetical protein MAPG_04251 [Magnaporthiopsis poae ATCC 64411]|uniref:LEA domain-containing protein n=1 Tax=Magnaporthiopsis poae (strain ATCC 64411 / 73-15) TaxID=644358 RepID=A0A0C4DW77_MAGP6|nr:hypothetical protein MAPG_04251 [Magnaporthiopsis poae ATCC 64411]